jgi:hypothetical protein
MKLKKMAVTVATIGALCASSYAFAARYYSHYTYYSDASRTTVVGVRINTCAGTVIMNGTMTVYSTLDDRFNCNL